MPDWSGSGPGADVLEEIEPALAGADEVDVAVAVDVDGGHLQPGAGGAGGEVLEGQTLLSFCRGVPGGLSLEDDLAGPCIGVLVVPVPGDHRGVGGAGLDFMGIDPLAGDQLILLAVAVQVGP